MQKEAIDIGITDYLVKPVTGAQPDRDTQEDRSEDRGGAREAEAADAGGGEICRQAAAVPAHGLRKSIPMRRCSRRRRNWDLSLDCGAVQYHDAPLFSEEKEDVLPEKIKPSSRSLEKYMEQSGNLIVAKAGPGGVRFCAEGHRAAVSRGDDRAGKKPAGRVFPERDGGGVCRGAPGHRWSVSASLQQCYRQTNLCFSRRYSVERNQILEEETPGRLRRRFWRM